MASGSKRKKFGVDDPRTFPASQFNKPLMKINMPFLRMKKLEEAGEVSNKFYGGKMVPEVLSHCQQQVLDPFLYDFGLTYTGTGELQTRINLGAVPVAVRRLMPKSIDDYDFRGLAKQTPDPVYSQAAEEEETEDIQSTPPNAPPTTLQSPANSPGSARDFAARHEDNRFLLRNQAVDLVVEVTDKAIYSNPSYSTADASCASLVIDGKDDELRENWLESNCWQTAFYTYFHAMNNIAKGRTSAVNFGCVSKGYWASGCLVPEGTVTLENGGQLTEAAVKDFLDGKSRLQGKSLKVTEDEMNKSKTILDEQLGESLTLMRGNFSNDTLGLAKHDNGSYLVGTLYYSQHVYENRKYPAKIIPTSDEYGFLEGLLRSCLGDRVLSWKSKEEVDAVLKRNDEAKRKAIAEAWVYHKPEVLEVQWPSKKGKFV